MKLVDKQILRELAGPFIFGVMAFSSVFFAGTYLQKLTQWMMDGMPVMTALQILVMLLPSVLVYTLPMSTLLAVLMAIGRLSGESEMVALFAGGVSFYRIAAPIIAMGIFISAGSIAFDELVVPPAHERSAELMAAVQKQILPQNQPFTTMDKGTKTRVDVNGGMDAEKGILRNVTVIHYDTNNQPTDIVYAARAQWAGILDDKKKYQWRLCDGWEQTVGTDSSAIVSFDQTHVKEIEIQKTPSQFSLYQKSNDKDSDQLSFTELSQIVKYVKQHPDRPLEEIRQLEVNRWNKLAFPLSSLVFAMLAAPLGIRPHRSSSSVGFGLSILVIFMYYIVWHYTSQVAIQGSLDPLFGAFLADILGIITAFGFLRRAAT